MGTVSRSLPRHFQKTNCPVPVNFPPAPSQLPPARVLPSGDQATEKPFLSGNPCKGRPERALQMRILSPAVATWCPSGDQASDQTPLRGVGKFRSYLPLEAFHNEAWKLSSLPPDASTRPFGE